LGDSSIFLYLKIEYFKKIRYTISIMYEYKVYKAKVTKVTIPDSQGSIQREIFITPLPNKGGGVWERPANPPNWLPTSTTGSGVVSYPSPGQECIIAEWGGERHIISYITPRNISPYGNLIPEHLDEGSTVLSSNGLKHASLRMDKYGGVSLFSNMYAQIGVDGTKKEVLAKGRNLKLEYSGGYSHALYNKEDKTTPYVQVFTQIKDNPGFSDVDFRGEEGYGKPLPQITGPYEYPNKAIIRAGHIPQSTHVYEIETRQSINPRSLQDKNLTTSFKLGFQEKNERFPNKEFGEGTIFELTSKKNFKDETGIFWERYGKLKNSNPGSYDKGEIYKFLINEGINNNKSFGSSIVNPMGEGEGWISDYKERGNQTYLVSYGKLLEGGSKIKGSISRTLFFDKSQDIKYEKVIGGDHFLYESFNKEDDYILKEFNNDHIQTIYKLRNFNITETYDNSRTVKYIEGGKEELFDIKKGKITLKTSDDVQIIMEKDKIIFKMRQNTLELSTSGGLKYNNQALLFEGLLDILLQNSGSIAGPISPGPSAPMFPALLAALNSRRSLPPQSTQALKTG